MNLGNLTAGRWVAWAVAIIAIMNAAVLALTPLTGDYPAIGPVLLIITSITAMLSPFLPRAQGRPSPEVIVVEEKKT
jgi:hypothetical protein